MSIERDKKIVDKWRDERMSTVNTSYTVKSYNYSVGNSGKNSQNNSSSEKRVRESVVDEYKRKHPKDAAHVDAQVKAGKAIWIKNGVQNVSTEDMTMEEYKNYFYSLVDSIPCDSTRIYDEEIISISDKGWEQMKHDPDYEAWVLGYFAEDRAVRNPFFGWGGNRGNVVIEHFGASIEEHLGQSFSKSAISSSGPKTADDEESWWTKRHKRMKKLLKEQAVVAQIQAKEKSEIAQQEYLKHQLDSQQRLHSFLAGNTENNQQEEGNYNQSITMGAATYESIISAYSRSVKQ